MEGLKYSVIRTEMPKQKILALSVTDNYNVLEK